MSYTETALIKVTFSGRSDQGPISVPGLKVGDMALAIHHGPNTWDMAVFRPFIDTDDTIFQAEGTDYSAVTFTAIIARFP